MGDLFTVVMTRDYFIVDIETIPLDYVTYKALPEEEKKNYFNPILSKIVAIGVRHKDVNSIFLSMDEKSILDEFWNQWDKIRGNAYGITVVGFNITDFDIPMLIGRSFFNDVPIVPFTLKELVDLRQRLAAFKYSPKGTLKEYAKNIGMTLSEFDGSMVAELVATGRLAELKGYLERDLELTDAVFKRAEKLNITKIERW